MHIKDAVSNGFSAKELMMSAIRLATVTVASLLDVLWGVAFSRLRNTDKSCSKRYSSHLFRDSLHLYKRITHKIDGVEQAEQE